MKARVKIEADGLGSTVNVAYLEFELEAENLGRLISLVQSAIIKSKVTGLLRIDTPLNQS